MNGCSSFWCVQFTDEVHYFTRGHFGCCCLACYPSHPRSLHLLFISPTIHLAFNGVSKALWNLILIIHYFCSGNAANGVKYSAWAGGFGGLCWWSWFTSTAPSFSDWRGAELVLGTKTSKICAQLTQPLTSWCCFCSPHSLTPTYPRSPHRLALTR